MTDYEQQLYDVIADWWDEVFARPRKLDKNDTIIDLVKSIMVLQAPDKLYQESDKIKYAYPQPKMTLQQEGDYAVVSYNDTTYYRFMNETTFAWYIKKGVSANHPVPTLVMITDAETERLLDGLYYNHIEVKKEKEMIRQNLSRE